MRVKSSSHVVEEMISLSRLYRANETQQIIEEVVPIRVKSFHQPSAEPAEKVAEMTEQQRLSQQKINEDRERLLEEIEQQRQQQLKVLEKMREEAEQDIGSMRQAWESERSTLEEQAYQEGYQSGFVQGQTEAHEQYKDQIALANQVTADAKKNANIYLQEQERVVLELALAVASKIMDAELEEQEERFLPIVKKAMKQARESKEIKLFISPTYYPLVTENRAEIVELFPPDVPFLIFADDEFEPEECYIETNHGRIVVTIDEQLNLLKEQLVELLESGD